MIATAPVRLESSIVIEASSKEEAEVKIVELHETNGLDYEPSDADYNEAVIDEIIWMDDKIMQRPQQCCTR